MIELISGVPGSGKTVCLKNEILNTAKEKTIIVLDAGKDYKGLTKELNGNIVAIRPAFCFNPFEFVPCGIYSGPVYEEYYQHFIVDLAKTIILHLFSNDKELERLYIQSALVDMYGSVGITKNEYKPAISNISDYLNFDIFTDFMEEKNLELTLNLKKYRNDFLIDNNISNFFSASKQDDFSFSNSFNVIYPDGPFQTTISKDSITYATISRAIRKAKLFQRPILFVVDESFYFINKWWFEELILDYFKNNENAMVKLATQRILDIKAKMPTLFELISNFIIFRASPSDWDILKHEFNLSNEKAKELCYYLEVKTSLIISKK